MVTDCYWPVSDRCSGKPSFFFHTWTTCHVHHRYQQPSVLKQRKIGRGEIPLRLRDICAIRIRLEISKQTRDLALIELAFDSKLRACDLTKLRVRDVAHGEHVLSRAMVTQRKTQRPGRLEITDQIRSAVAAWIRQAKLRSEDCLSPSRLHTSDHLSIHQYNRIVKGWVKAVDLDPAL